MKSNKARTILFFLLPNLIGFVLFTAGPVLFSLAVSFTNWDLLRREPFEWVGLRNFTELALDQQFWLYLINTGYLMLGMPLAIVGALLLALLLTQKLRGMIAFRTLFYLPTFTAGVALFILWKMLYNPSIGPINMALDAMFNALGIEGMALPRWLISTQNLLGLKTESLGLTAGQFGVGAREALIIMGVWIGIGGNNMLLYISALSNVPAELHEAAQIDGANAWNRFIHITLPQIAPTTFFIVIMSFIGGLQGGFEQARVMTGGGPAGTTTTLAYYIYTKAFEEFQMGYACALSWVLFVIIFAITMINWKYGNRQLND